MPVNPSLLSLRHKALGILDGTASGRHTKRSLARDILKLEALVVAHRREFLTAAADTSAEYGPAGAPNPSEADHTWAEECLRDFEAEALNEYAEQMEAA